MKWNPTLSKDLKARAKQRDARYYPFSSYSDIIYLLSLLHLASRLCMGISGAFQKKVVYRAETEQIDILFYTTQS